MMEIFKGVFGSHLYGLNTINSDLDFKSVWVPTKSEIIFGEYKDSEESKVDGDDHSKYAITKFYHMLSKSDTVSMDMLHTPEEFQIKGSSVWNKLYECRGDLYSKNMRGLIGYIKSMSTKYGNKQERYAELVDFRDCVSLLNRDGKVSKTTLPEIANRVYKYISYNETRGNVIGNIDVLGSRYQINMKVSSLLDLLESKVSSYGDRVIKGNAMEGDFKSVSHSLRVLYQMEEIIDTRDLRFPLKDKAKLLEVKTGKVDYNDVMKLIDEKFDIVMSKLNNSDLPDANDMSNIRNIILEVIG